MIQDQPIQFTRAAAIQIRETVARQRTGLRRDLATVDSAAAGAELQTGSEDAFPVIIAKDGGTDGTTSTRATWTYTVQNVDGTQLATAITVAKPRPLGPLDYGNKQGGTAFGLAFYTSAGQLTLWDAGELPTAGTQIYYGKAAAEFTTGATVTVTPCAPDGTATGAANVPVYLKWDKTSFDCTVDAGGNNISASIAADTVLAFVVAADGNRYVTEQPRCIVTRIDYSGGIRTYHRWLLGGAKSTEGTSPVTRITFYGVEVHQVRWNATDKKLEVRTATIRVPTSATWSAWGSILDFECLSADTINSLTGGLGGGSY